MGEQSPEQAKPPTEKIQAKCWSCDHMVRSEVANTHTLIYTRQPYFNNTQLACHEDDCGATTVLFHDRIPEKGVAIAVQYTTSIYEFCDDETIQAIRRKVVDVHDLIPRQLSNRVEEQIAHWGEFLQRVLVDETDFGVGNETA